MSISKTYQPYLITAVLLCIYFGVRLFRIDALPFFIDESILVGWSEQVRAGNPLTFGYDGRYLVPWLLAIFNPVEASPFVTRFVVILWTLLGAAAIIATGRRLHSWQAGWFGLLLIVLTPMLHFHDRLALTDTVLHSMLTLLCLFLLWAFDAPQLCWKRAASCGGFFVLCVLTKSSAVVLLPLPIAAAVLLPKTWTLQNRIKGITTFYGAFIAGWLPLQLVLLWRNIDFWGRAAQGSTSGALLDFGRILSNVTFVWEGMSGYWHPLMWLFIGIGILLALIFKPPYSLFLLAMVLGYSFALILFGGNLLYFRYWIPVLPITLLLAMVGYTRFSTFIQPHPRTSSPNSRRGNKYIAPTVVVLFAFIFSVKFVYQSYTNPLELKLPHLDRQQYIEADSAGTAIPETAAFLRDSTLPIVGAFPQCHTLSLYLRREITCLNIAGDAAIRLPRINAELAQQETPFYLVLENRGYATSADITAVTLNPVAIFERPGGLVAIIVYEASDN